MEIGGARLVALGGALAALHLGLLWPAGAGGIPSSGPHETVNLWTNTTHPNTSAALGYAARYHAAGDPQGDPPALRHLVIRLPRGTRLDTSVPPRCTASDLELRVKGESACPPSARVGAGRVTVKTAMGVATYDTVLYNAPDDLLELVKSGDMVVGVAHTYVHGRTLDGPIPTCILGGQPPSGCPSDELTLLSNHLRIRPVSVGHGAARRNYGTTPPTCPRSRLWKARVRLEYADGSVDRVTPRGRCTRRR